MPEDAYRSFRDDHDFNKKLLGKDIPKPDDDVNSTGSTIVRALACVVTGIAIGLLISPH